MKKLSVVGILLGTMVMCAAPVSIHWSPAQTLSLSVDKADARVGRRLTRVKPIVVSVLDYSKGFGHTDLVTC